MPEKPTREELEKKVQNLQQAEEELAQIFSMSLDMICIADINTATFIKVNPAFTEILGYSEKALLEKPFLDFVHPDDIDATRTVIERKLQSGANVINFKNRYRSVDGSYRWLNWVSHPNPEKGITYAVARDITEAKQKEAEIEESNTLLDATGRMAKVGGWEVDTNTLEVTWTKETHRIHEVPFDYKPTLQGAIKFFHPEYRGRLEAAIQRALDHGEPYDMEIRFITAKGKHLWTRTICKPEMVDGKTVKLTGTFQDITDRKRAEALLRESENKYRIIAENMADIITTMDMNLRFTYVSPSIIKLRGFTVEEALEQTIDQIMTPDSFQLLANAFEEQLRLEATATADPDRTLILELEEYKKDGSTIWVENKASFIRDKDQKPVGILVVSRDISERRRAEEELKEISSHQDALLSAIPDIVVEVDIHKVYTWANQSGYDFFGDDLIGKETGFYFEGEQDTYEVVKPIFDGEEDVVFLESWQRRKDGEKRLLAWWCKVLKDKTGHVRGALSTARDITDQLKMQEQLRQTQKMEAIGNLAGGIAHDFNNILSSVLGYTELTLDRVEEGSKIEEDLQAVYKAGNRAKDLVQQILTFARQSDEEIKPIQVTTIAKEVIHFVRSTIPTTINIQSDIQSNSLIMGNATQVHQIFMNLCTNAAHAMEDEGGLLEISVQDVSIESHSKTGLEPGNYIEIKVKDTGTGIPPDIIDFIFEPYYTTKPPGEGTGMGLAVVHGIIEKYNGEITVDSKMNEGTVFSVYLPTVKQRDKNKQKYERQLLPTGNERIMFVDDEAPIAKMGGQMLEKLGYSVVTFTSSKEALEIFRVQPNDFDMVITDTAMPELPGDKFAMKLQEIRSEIPVILCTGYSKKLTGETAKKIGIKAFVQKPIVKADLAKTVRSVLDGIESKQPSGCILLIDDEPDFRKLFVNKLEGEGYEIIEAGNGKEGLTLFREHNPDLVVTDLVMPEKEGIETIKELKKDFPDVRIIAVSGGGRNIPDAYLNIAKKMGAERTFPKPIDWTELIQAVQDLID